MLFDLKPEILEDFFHMKNVGIDHAKILRHIFKKYGAISPPIMAGYFVEIYGFQVHNFLPIVSCWWPDNSLGLSDNQFNENMDLNIKELRSNK
jgi:hypothetical protein